MRKMEMNMKMLLNFALLTLLALPLAGQAQQDGSAAAPKATGEHSADDSSPKAVALKCKTNTGTVPKGSDAKDAKKDSCKPGEVCSGKQQ